MGEAKHRKAAMREQLLETLERWAFPTSQWEADTVADLKTLPVVMVKRMAPATIAYMRMPASKCHANCQWYEANDPTGTFKATEGWLVDPDGNYVHHSVLSNGVQYICITPPIADNRAFFEFIPDPAITWVEAGNGYIRAMRGGQAIGPGVRCDPEKTIATLADVKKKLMAGVHPMKAMER